jgi:hypothetical protein
LRPAFVSKSVNNAGFLAALLRAVGLLVPAIENVQQHVLTDDWEIWKSVMLSDAGVPYDPEVKSVASSVKPESPAAPKKNGPEPVVRAKANPRLPRGLPRPSTIILTFRIAVSGRHEHVR